MDEADISDERIEIARSDSIDRIRRENDKFIQGEPGDCDKCGNARPRLVNGWCCYCRDKYKVG
jgi:hypothetical protein